VKKISIIIPIYNEEVSLKKNFNKIYRFFKKNFYSYEIIMIESGSFDNSFKLCKNFEKLKNVKLFHQKKREGFGSAIKIGIKKITGEFFCIIPIDLCFDIKILKIIKKEKFDLLTSFRINDDRSYFRKIQSYFYNVFIKLIFGLKIKSINASPKIFRSKFIKNKKLYSRGWTIDAEILFHFSKKKIKYILIPVNILNRKYGSSKINFFDIIKIIIESLILRIKISLF